MKEAAKPHQKKVKIQTDYGDLSVAPGTPLLEVISQLKKQEDDSYLGAVLNHRLVDLDEPLWGPSRCRGVTINDGWMGASIYRRSVIIVLYEAAKELYPNLRLEIGQSLGNGYHFLLRSDTPEDADWVEKLMNRCNEIIDEKRIFQKTAVNIEAAKAIFIEQNTEDKVGLLHIQNRDVIKLVTLGGYYDLHHGPVVPTTGHLDHFKLEAMPPGFVLQFGNLRVGIGKSPSEQKKLFQVYQETRNWHRILGITNVSQLNEQALKGNHRELIAITEGFHEKKIAQIADKITEQEGVKVILIAGPSSAGKTTFAQRLSVQLRINGLQPVALSLDDYYLNWEQMPRLPDGRYDFESIDSLDLPLFNSHLDDLLHGKEIIQPHFNFHTGKRTPKETWTKRSITPNQIIIIEGIHGLNPRLTEKVPNELKFRVFINALTQLNLDENNRIFTSETRLLRRMVRDKRYRGHSAARTIELWPLVRDGERKYILPFHEEADVTFNSHLIYEPSILKMFAERYLLEVPREHPSAAFAHRLRNFLQLFVPILPEDVPKNSILREFIGDAQRY